MSPLAADSAPILKTRSSDLALIIVLIIEAMAAIDDDTKINTSGFWKPTASASRSVELGETTLSSPRT
jgi:hypothetical protein